MMASVCVNLLLPGIPVLQICNLWNTAACRGRLYDGALGFHFECISISFLQVVSQHHCPGLSGQHLLLLLLLQGLSVLMSSCPQERESQNGHCFSTLIFIGPVNRPKDTGPQAPESRSPLGPSATHSNGLSLCTGRASQAVQVAVAFSQSFGCKSLESLALLLFIPLNYSPLPVLTSSLLLLGLTVH